jgi:Zn finger protein HypA/HybF involved in hydrogenase expression
MKKIEKPNEYKKHRFDSWCIRCHTITLSEKDIFFCSSCGSKWLTVNDYKTLKSTTRSEDV